ncbi:Acyl-CoA desaturase [Merluccius polli]|uniref:Acyl-CoA desaturase n=1 Tax=Merluccius polli TaxID=89951 RepID=A0AA47NVM5_MERPO|nr:Acyl-CoA desaturase [Merluccius polli]
MTEADTTRNRQQQHHHNGAAASSTTTTTISSSTSTPGGELTSTVEDVFDDTYREREGPKPPRRLVWRNIVLMLLLHSGALYGLTLVPSASVLTLAWSK